MIRKAKGYLEAFNNVDYRVIDKIGFKDEVKTFLDPSLYYISKNGNKINQDDRINNYFNWTKDNKIICEGRFISDTSIVYLSTDGFTRIKGVLQWQIKECANPSILTVNVGEWYEDDLEVELARWGGTPETFSKEISLKEKILIEKKPEWSE